jgi:hypothetical protein
MSEDHRRGGRHRASGGGETSAPSHNSTVDDYSMSLSELGNSTASVGSPRHVHRKQHRGSNHTREPPPPPSTQISKSSPTQITRKSPKSRRARLAASADHISPGSGHQHSKRSHRSGRTGLPLLDQEEEGENLHDSGGSKRSSSSKQKLRGSRSRSSSEESHPSSTGYEDEHSSDDSQEQEDVKQPARKNSRTRSLSAGRNRGRLNGSSHHSSTSALRNSRHNNNTTSPAKNHHSTGTIGLRGSNHRSSNHSRSSGARAGSASPHRQREKLTTLRQTQSLDDNKERGSSHSKSNKLQPPPLSDDSGSGIYLTSDDDGGDEEVKALAKEQAKEFLKTKIRKQQNDDDNSDDDSDSVYSDSDREDEQEVEVELDDAGPTTIVDMRQAFQRNFPGVPLPSDEALRERYAIPTDEPMGLRRKGSLNKNTYLNGGSAHQPPDPSLSGVYSDRITATPAATDKEKAKRVPVPIPWLDKREEDKEEAPQESSSDDMKAMSTPSRVKKFLRKSVMVGAGRNTTITNQEGQGNNADKEKEQQDLFKSPGATPRPKRTSVIGKLTNRVALGSAHGSKPSAALETPLEEGDEENSSTDSSKEELALRKKTSFESAQGSTATPRQKRSSVIGKLANRITQGSAHNSKPSVDMEGDDDDDGSDDSSKEVLELKRKASVDSQSSRKSEGDIVSPKPPGVKFSETTASPPGTPGRNRGKAISNFASKVASRTSKVSKSAIAAMKSIDTQDDDKDVVDEQKKAEKEQKKLEKEQKRQEKELRKTAKKQEKQAKKEQKEKDKELQQSQSQDTTKGPDEFEQSHEDIMALSGKVDEMFSPEHSPGKKSAKKAFGKALSRVSKMIQTPKKSPKDVVVGSADDIVGGGERASTIEDDIKRAMAELPDFDELDDEEESEASAEPKPEEPSSNAPMDLKNKDINSEELVDDHEAEYGEMSLKGEDSNRSRGSRSHRARRSRSPKSSSSDRDHSSRSSRTQRSRSPKSSGAGDSERSSRTSSRSSRSSSGTNSRSRSSSTKRRSSKEDRDRSRSSRSSRQSSRRSRTEGSSSRKSSSRRSASPTVLRGHKEGKRESRRSERKKEKTERSLSPSVLRGSVKEKRTKRSSRNNEGSSKSFGDSSTYLEPKSFEGSAASIDNPSGGDSSTVLSYNPSVVSAVTSATNATKTSRVKFAPMDGIADNDHTEGSDFNEEEFENVEKMKVISSSSPGAMKKILKTSEFQRAREREAATPEEPEDDGKAFTERLKAMKNLPKRAGSSMSTQSSASTDLEDLLDKVSEKAKKRADRLRSDRSAVSATSKTSRTARSRRSAPAAVQENDDKDASTSSEELAQLMDKVSEKTKKHKMKRRGSAEDKNSAVSSVSRKSAPASILKGQQGVGKEEGPKELESKTAHRAWKNPLVSTSEEADEN